MNKYLVKIKNHFWPQTIQDAAKHDCDMVEFFLLLSQTYNLHHLRQYAHVFLVEPYLQSQMYKVFHAFVFFFCSTLLVAAPALFVFDSSRVFYIIEIVISLPSLAYMLLAIRAFHFPFSQNQREALKDRDSSDVYLKCHGDIMDFLKHYKKTCPELSYDLSQNLRLQYLMKTLSIQTQLPHQWYKFEKMIQEISNFIKINKSSLHPSHQIDM